jgi:Beta protein
MLEEEEPRLRYPLIFDHRHYVPRLLGKWGEYQALRNLHTVSRHDVTPLIDVPEIGYDFETREDAKTIDEHLERLGTRFGRHWGDLWAFIDLKLIERGKRMKDGRHPLRFVFDEVRKNNALAIPTTGLDRDSSYQQAILEITQQDRSGVCIRLRVEDVATADFQTRLLTLLKELRVELEQCHLILDLNAPATFEPLEGFAKMVRGQIARLPELDRWRTYTVMGTSFPRTLRNLTLGVHIIKRHDWLFYKELVKTLAPSERKPTFGDYAIASPEVKPPKPVNPRFVKTPANIRYAINQDAWYLVKGGNVHEEKGNRQYIKFCAALFKSGLFLGDRFSEGSNHIKQCMQRRVTPGNPTTWRWVGTNHHIEKTVSDLANLNGS